MAIMYLRKPAKIADSKYFQIWKFPECNISKPVATSREIVAEAPIQVWVFEVEGSDKL